MKSPWGFSALFLYCAIGLSATAAAGPSPSPRETASLATAATLSELRDELTLLQRDAQTLSAQLRSLDQEIKRKKSRSLAQLTKASKKRASAAKELYSNTLRRDAELTRASLSETLRQETLVTLQSLAITFGPSAAQSAMATMAQFGDLSDETRQVCLESLVLAENLLASASIKGASNAAVDRRLSYAISSLQAGAAIRAQFEEAQNVLQGQTIPALQAAAESGSQSSALSHLQNISSLFSSARSDALTAAGLASEQAAFLFELLKNSEVIGDTPQAAALEEQLYAANAAHIQFAARAIAYQQAYIVAQGLLPLAQQASIPLQVTAQTAESSLASLAEHNNTYLSALSSAEGFEAEILRVRTLVNRPGFFSELKNTRSLLKFHRGESFGTAKKTASYFAKLSSILATHFEYSPQAGLASIELLSPALVSIAQTAAGNAAFRNAQTPALQANLLAADASYSASLQSAESGTASSSSVLALAAAKAAIQSYSEITDQRNWEALLLFSLDELVSSAGLSATTESALRQAAEDLVLRKRSAKGSALKAQFSLSLSVCRASHLCERSRLGRYRQFFRHRRVLFSRPKAALDRASEGTFGLSLSEIRQNAKVAIDSVS